MKTTSIGLITALISLYNACGSPDQTQAVAQPLPRPFNSLVNHSTFPSDIMIASKRVNNDLAVEEIDELAVLLRKCIRSPYVPGKNQIDEKVVACRKLQDDSDYLLMRYSTTNLLDIEIQDGAALYLTVTPKDTNAQVTAASGIADYVKKSQRTY